MKKIRTWFILSVAGAIVAWFAPRIPEAVLLDADSMERP